MTQSRPDGHAPVPLTQLLAQAAAELDAQPAPPMSRALFDALPIPAQAIDAAPFALVKASPRATASASPPPAAPGSRSLRFGWPTVAAAFSLMLVNVTVLLVLTPPPDGGDVAYAAGFIPVAPQERWSRLKEDGGAAWVVTTELPQARLASYGLPFDPAHAADTVRAELLMRASGEVLAVRVLY